MSELLLLLVVLLFGFISGYAIRGWILRRQRYPPDSLE